MYTFSKRLKTVSIALMIVGFIGIVWGFSNAPSTIEESKEIIANAQDGHGGGHGDAHAAAPVAQDSHSQEAHAPAHVEAVHGDAHASEHHDASHDEHLFHQLQNRPWSAIFVAIFFFFMLALGTLAFYAIQFVSQAGWSIVLLRVMEGITGYLPVGAILIFVFLALSGFHFNHVFAWMNPELVDPNSPHFDELLFNKKAYLNVPGLLIRAAIYIGGWIWYRQRSRKLTLELDKAENGDLTYYKKLMGASAAFLVFFLVTESMMSWDWLMSIDHHWFSTLYGWYVFSGMFVSAITTIALVTIYLRSRGYLEFVNDSHLHDLAKLMFGFSIFWTYLWFSQFMLIWYANIPEEVTYYAQRFDEIKVPFFAMVVMNFVFPILLLINSDYKRMPWFISIAGIVVLFGHYIDIYVLITPGTVGGQWKFISPEVIGSLLFFLGLFIYIVFTTLTKAPLKVQGNPFLKESENFHY